MKTQSAVRNIQSLFPALLASLLVLGTAQLVFDSLKKRKSYVFQFYDKPEKQRKSVFVLPEDRMGESCKLFEGQWVWDNVSYPLYKENSCPYLVKQTTCLKKGRHDSFYQNWRWQPNACNLPRCGICRFEIRNSAFATPYHQMEYYASIEYYWAPFIVESNSDRATKHTVLKRLVNLDSISKHGKSWEGVDVSWEWKPGSNENCFNETYPIQESYWGTGSNLAIMDKIQDILRDLKINVTFLNITQLSEYKKDCHTTVFGERRGKLLTKEQRADPKNFADCIHWCLPGVPDT
ncbi:hypothetical protein REPUB_Repub11eG0047000 [Reevesia pubescens]